jgi:hypothetical protein
METNSTLVIFAIIAALGLVTVVAVDIMLTTQKAKAQGQAVNESMGVFVVPANNISGAISALEKADRLTDKLGVTGVNQTREIILPLVVIAESQEALVANQQEIKQTLIKQIGPQIDSQLPGLDSATRSKILKQLQADISGIDLTKPEDLSKKRCWTIFGVRVCIDVRITANT